ncbi:MAG: FAD-dependent monooxygenase [Hyphomicrobiales bacterium]|nr:FAD-dependent monooxygenase [Hyphomicrobiales bacterium]
MQLQTDNRIVDAVIAGAGPAGMAATLALRKAGLNAICTGPAPGAESVDRRTTALLHGSIRFLEKTLGLWDSLAPHAAPLKTLRLIDRTGRLFRAPDMMFSASEIGEDSFGWNIPNAILTAGLMEALGGQFVPSDGVIAMTDEENGGAIRLRLADGREYLTRLLVGADGRNSFCRKNRDIAVRQWSYNQAALVCNLQHERPHRDACTEFHGASGPLTLVPLPGDASSLVWVETPERARELQGLNETDFLTALTARAGRVNGRFISAGPRAVFPLSGLIARRLTAHRMALVGEAGHVMPPIGAQGLNLGFRDAADLADCVAGADDPGARAVLANYERRRARDVWLRTNAADLLNRTLISNLPIFQLARALGLGALGVPGPLRRAAMRQGMSTINQ